MFRRRKPEIDLTPPFPDLDAEIDWATIPPRLRPYVDDAVDALDRWRRMVARHETGPLRDRFDTFTPRIRTAVDELRLTAVRVDEIERALAGLDPDRVAAEFKDARRRVADGDAPEEFPALEARFASVQRMMNAVADAEERMRLLDVRLGAVVAQGTEVALIGSAADLRALDHDLDALTDELTNLRGAWRDLG